MEKDSLLAVDEVSRTSGGLMVMPDKHRLTDDPENPVELSDIDAIKRVEFIIECMGRFYRRAFCIHLVMKKFGIAIAQAYRDYNKALEDNAQYAKEHKDSLIGQTVNQMNGIARRAALRKEFNSAIMAVKHRDDVLGLTGKVELSGQITQNVNHALIGVSDKALAALGDAYAGATGGDRGKKPSKVRKKQDSKG
jgi:hypothetical protein